MFTAEQIQNRLRQQPFQPVRIVASEGLRYEIHHPDLVLVGRHDLTIGTPDPDTPSIYSGVVRVAIVHIVAMQDLPASAPTSSNGPAS
jgi:hypothetical protein